MDGAAARVATCWMASCGAKPIAKEVVANIFCMRKLNREKSPAGLSARRDLDKSRSANGTPHMRGGPGSSIRNEGGMREDKARGISGGGTRGAASPSDASGRELARAGRRDHRIGASMSSIGAPVSGVW